MNRIAWFFVVIVAAVGIGPTAAQTATPAPTATPALKTYRDGLYYFGDMTEPDVDWSGNITVSVSNGLKTLNLNTSTSILTFVIEASQITIWRNVSSGSFVNSNAEICFNAVCQTMQNHLITGWYLNMAPITYDMPSGLVNVTIRSLANGTSALVALRVLDIRQGHVVASSGGGSPMPDLSAGLYEAETTGVFTLTGSWVQVVDGAYSVMESTTTGDTASLTFNGSEIIIYRELLASGGGDVEVCLNTSCATLSNTAISDQLRVPASYRTDSLGAGPYTLTIENTSGGTFRLDYVVIVGSEPGLVGGGSSVSPSTQYITLETGRVVGVDYSINGGDIAQIIFLAFIAAVLLYSLLIQRASPND